MKDVLAQMVLHKAMLRRADNNRAFLKKYVEFARAIGGVKDASGPVKEQDDSDATTIIDQLSIGVSLSLKIFDELLEKSLSSHPIKISDSSPATSLLPVRWRKVFRAVATEPDYLRWLCNLILLRKRFSIPRLPPRLRGWVEEMLQYAFRNESWNYDPSDGRCFAVKLLGKKLMEHGVSDTLIRELADLLFHLYLWNGVMGRDLCHTEHDRLGGKVRALLASKDTDPSKWFNMARTNTWWDGCIEAMVVNIQLEGNPTPQAPGVQAPPVQGDLSIWQLITDADSEAVRTRNIESRLDANLLSSCGVSPLLTDFYLEMNVGSVPSPTSIALQFCAFSTHAIDRAWSEAGYTNTAMLQQHYTVAGRHAIHLA